MLGCDEAMHAARGRLGWARLGMAAARLGILLLLAGVHVAWKHALAGQPPTPAQSTPAQSTPGGLEPPRDASSPPQDPLSLGAGVPRMEASSRRSVRVGVWILWLENHYTPGSYKSLQDSIWYKLVE